MVRWAFNVLTGLSLVLLLVMLYRWDESYASHRIWPSYAGTKRHYYLINAHGWERLQVSSDWPSHAPPERRTTALFRDGYAGLSNSGGGGFQGGHFHGVIIWWSCRQDVSWGGSDGIPPQPASGVMFRTIMVRYWLLILVTSVLPALWVCACAWQIRTRRRRRNARHCSNCNYDLRAHDPGQRCPECGTVIPGEAPAGPESGDQQLTSQ